MGLITVNDSSMEAVLNEPEANKGTWGPAALEQRRERSRNHVAKIAVRRDGWIDRNKYYYELLNLNPLCRRHSRLLVITYNHLWEPLVTFAEWIGMKVPRTEQNWLSTLDIANLLKLAGFEALETHRIVILPKYVPLVSAFLNRFCARLPLLKRLCMTQIVVARLC